jgi:hypothetical protein
MRFDHWRKYFVLHIWHLLRYHPTGITQVDVFTHLKPERPLIKAFYENHCSPKMTAIYISEHIVDRHMGFKRKDYTYEILDDVPQALLNTEMADMTLAYRWVKKDT